MENFFGKKNKMKKLPLPLIEKKKEKSISEIKHKTEENKKKLSFAFNMPKILMVKGQGNENFFKQKIFPLFNLI